MAKKKVAVIGAGLGGLSTALRLACAGFEVHVFEKNTAAGGKAGEFEKDGFRFDSGPSLLTMPFVLEELFEFAGEKLDDYIHLTKLKKVCKYFYPEGTVIEAYSDLSKLVRELESKTVVAGKNILEYFDYARTIYNLSAELFLFKSFVEPSTFINKKALKTLVNIKRLDINRSMHKANSSFFNDKKVVQLFDRYATYNGSNPYKAPATLNIIQHVEFGLGGYFVEGGVNRIPKVLKELAEERSVNFHFDSPVDQISVKNGSVVGIIAGNEKLLYDIIISNADVHYTYSQLLEDSTTRSAKRYSRLEKSSSAIVFYWGVNNIHPELEAHNIFFSEDYGKEFKQLFDEKRIPDDPTIYVYVSSKLNSKDAPEGNENWFVMINAPNRHCKDWSEEVKLAKSIIFNRIKRVLDISLETEIVCEEILTPVDIEKKTNSSAGSIYGISSNSRMSAFMRQQNRSKDYKGLYFCGGSAHPGGGIPLVLLSGKITSELIMKYEMK